MSSHTCAAAAAAAAAASGAPSSGSTTSSGGRRTIARERIETIIVSPNSDEREVAAVARAREGDRRPEGKCAHEDTTVGLACWFGERCAQEDTVAGTACWFGREGTQDTAVGLACRFGTCEREQLRVKGTVVVTEERVGASCDDAESSVPELRWGVLELDWRASVVAREVRTRGNGSSQ